MAMFPFDVWGNVRASAAGGEVKIKVVQSPGGGYLFLTKENGTEYDTWIETLEEVEADLHALDVEWPSSRPNPTTRVAGAPTRHPDADWPTGGRGGLSRARARMAAIDPWIDPALLHGTRPLDRGEQPFAAAVALARMLLEGIGVLDGGEQSANGFLVNLESLFERTVVRALRESGIDVEPQALLPYARWDGTGLTKGSGFAIDARCRGLPGGDLIVDAKYKRHISSANLHQMIAYCVLTGARRAAFIVPSGTVVDQRGYVFTPGSSTTQIRVDVVELATHAVDVASWRAHGKAMAAALATG